MIVPSFFTPMASIWPLQWIVSFVCLWLAYPWIISSEFFILNSKHSSIVLTNSFNWFSSTRFKSIFFPRRFFMNLPSLRWALNPSRWVILLSLLSDVVLDVLTKPGSTGGNEAQTISFVRPFWNYESAKQNIIKTEEVNIFIWKI